MSLHYTEKMRIVALGVGLLFHRQSILTAGDLDIKKVLCVKALEKSQR
jgi:hypothetical protein